MDVSKTREKRTGHKIQGRLLLLQSGMDGMTVDHATLGSPDQTLRDLSGFSSLRPHRSK